MPTGFEIFSSIIFACAVIHTFLTPTFYSLSEKYDQKRKYSTAKINHYRSLSEIYYLLSEIELVFGFWLIPLAASLFFLYGLNGTINYLKSHDYTYALYMTVMVVLISTKPVILFAEKLFEYIARLGGDSLKSWWWTILTIGPLLCMILKEPGAMTLSAILLSKACFPYIRNNKFRYGTLALLFINVSIGGLLAPFSSRSLFLIAAQKDWDISYTFAVFGWKALIVILANNFICYFFIKGCFPNKQEPVFINEIKKKLPFWLVLIHLAFLAIIVLSSEYPVIFLGAFFLFIGVHRATFFYQGHDEGPLHLKPAIFIGFFYASLLIHGEFQSWWVVGLLRDINFEQGLLISTIASALIDNAIVLYLLEKIRPMPNETFYAIIVGALSSGGLTLMANGPNLIGYNSLKQFFGKKLSLLVLFLAALPLTIISLILFWILK